MRRFINETCAGKEINVKEHLMRSRRGRISEIRQKSAEKLVKEIGLPPAEIARCVGGGATSAVSKMMSRERDGIQPSPPVAPEILFNLGCPQAAHDFYCLFLFNA